MALLLGEVEKTGRFGETAEKPEPRVMDESNGKDNHSRRFRRIISISCAVTIGSEITQGRP
jgi:hypothetical protein